MTYVVLIFPTSKEQLLSGSELTSNPSWPGLRLCSGEMQLLPRPSTDERTTPTSTALRHAISAIMRKSSSPDIMEDITSLLEKWEHLAAHPTNFKEKAAPVSWPSMPAPEPETGE